MEDATGLIIPPAREEHKMGQHASATNELVFDNCRVPAGAMMGKLNDGFRIAVAELTGGGIGIGSLGLGIGLAAMDYATSYATERAAVRAENQHLSGNSMDDCRWLYGA